MAVHLLSKDHKKTYEIEKNKLNSCVYVNTLQLLYY